jgi:hypothetical protein
MVDTTEKHLRAHFTDEKILEDSRILKENLHNKLWRKGNTQVVKWYKLICELCLNHGVGMVVLNRIDEDKTPCYNRAKSEICLNSVSVISLLHELAHHYGTLDEATAFDYSERVFFTAMPKARSRLIKDERGYWVKKPTAEQGSATK